MIGDYQLEEEGSGMFGEPEDESLNPNQCDLKPTGPMKFKEVPGNGAKLNLHCNGGCIKMHKIRYTCKKERDTVQKQNQNRKKQCDGRPAEKGKN